MPKWTVKATMYEYFTYEVEAENHEEARIKAFQEFPDAQSVAEEFAIESLIEVEVNDST